MRVGWFLIYLIRGILIVGLSYFAIALSYGGYRVVADKCAEPLAGYEKILLGNMVCNWVN